VTFSPAPAEGDLVVIGVAVNSTGRTFTAANGYSLLTKGSNGDEGIICWKIAGAGESGTQAPCTINTSVTWRAGGRYATPGAGMTAELLGEDTQNESTSPFTTSSIAVPDNVGAYFFAMAHSDGETVYSNREIPAGSTSGVATVADHSLSNVSMTAWDRATSTGTSSWNAEVTGNVNVTSVAYLAIFGETPAAPEEVSVAGSQPASTATLTRSKQWIRSGAGSQPSATATLVRSQQFPRTGTGSQPNATGDLARSHQRARTAAGAQPAASGALSTHAAVSRAAAGSQPSASGALSRIRASEPSGSQPAATGTLARIISVARLLAGDQPAASGLLVTSVPTPVRHSVVFVQGQGA
jgi:hypothetical protein